MAFHSPTRYPINMPTPANTMDHGTCGVGGGGGVYFWELVDEDEEEGCCEEEEDEGGGVEEGEAGEVLPHVEEKRLVARELWEAEGEVELVEADDDGDAEGEAVHDGDGDEVGVLFELEEGDEEGLDAGEDGEDWEDGEAVFDGVFGEDAGEGACGAHDVEVAAAKGGGEDAGPDGCENAEQGGGVGGDGEGNGEGEGDEGDGEAGLDVAQDVFPQRDAMDVEEVTVNVLQDGMEAVGGAFAYGSSPQGLVLALREVDLVVGASSKNGRVL
jgi:hypothetical protein